MTVYNPTFSQQLIWLDQAISAGSAKYNIGGYACLEGELLPHAFNAAVNQVLRSQEIYYTVFDEQEGALLCRVNDAPVNYVMTTMDFSADTEPEKAALEWMAHDFSLAFEMRNTPLFHFRLLTISATRHFWYAKIHHLIGDGWSFKLLMNQTAELYDQYKRLVQVPMQQYRYSEYAAEDVAYYQSPAAADDRHYWLQEYKVLPPPLFQPLNKAPAPAKSGSFTLQVNASLKQVLEQVAEANKVSLFHLITGLVLVYFSRIRRQETIAVGVPVLNRTKKQYRHTAGVFMNLLSLKFDINAQDTFLQVLLKVKQKMSASLRHQRYQYGGLVKDLKLPGGHALLHHIRISYEDFDFSADFGGLQATAVALSNHAEVDPLAIYVREYHGQGFDIRFVYNQEYFNQEEISRIADRLHYMMHASVGHINQPVYAMRLMDEPEERRLLALSTGPVCQYQHNTYRQLWCQAVNRYGSHTAITFGQHRLSYAEVHVKARLFAIAVKALQQESAAPVALLLPGSAEVVIAMLGCLLAGVPYVPVDPEYPAARIAYILADARCTAVVTATAVQVPVNNPLLHVLYIDQLIDPAHTIIQEEEDITIDPASPCYIIYTSGSTGQPKGVVIAQHSLADYAATFRSFFSVTNADVVLQQASVSFDTSIEEIFPVLVSGGRLHLLQNRKDMMEISTALQTENITILSTNPWVLKFLNDMPLPPSVRLLISGGDVLKPAHINNLVTQPVAVYNTYGPTESTVCATYYKVEETDAGALPIGKPIANRRVYIVDEYTQLQVSGVEGEICIAGSGLAIAYLNQPALTSEKFIPDPFMPGQYMYKTGDRGVLLPDGNILFKGRIDEQINFRGYRVEPGEIENIINAQEVVADSIVEVKEWNGLPVLIAYIKYEPGCPEKTGSAWRQLFHKRLPAYLVPDVWITVDGFSLLPNGKVNRKALPAPDACNIENHTAEKLLPETALEKKLAGLWAALLNVTSIGVEDSFFESGGHSLNVVQLVNKIKEAFGIPLAIHDLFEKDTIRQQAALISGATPVAEQEEIQVDLLQDSLPLTPAQHRLWIISQVPEASIAYHISGAVRLSGNINAQHVRQALYFLLNRHEALRTVFTEDEWGNVLQKVLLPDEITADYHEYMTATETSEEALQQLMRSLISKPFNLAQAPLLRTALIRIHTNEYLFVYVMHHIISDGWSMEILRNEFFAVYQAFAAGEEVQLPLLNGQFRHYLQAMRRQNEEQYAEAAQFWLQKLSGPLPVTCFPTQHTRPAIKTYAGYELVKYFDKEHYQQLKNFCAQEGCTLFMGLFATLNALVFNYTGQQTTVIGTPVANRTGTAWQDQIGLYLNTLPVKTAFSHHHTFRQLLQVQKSELLQAYKNQQYPMDVLLEKMRYKQEAGHSPLFDILIVLHNQSILTGFGKDPTLSASSLQLTGFEEVPHETSQFDMTFAFYYEGDSIKLKLKYNTALFDHWFVSRIAAHFDALVFLLPANPDKPVASVDYLTAHETAALTTITPVATEKNYYHIIDYLFAAGRLNAASVAIAYNGTDITYAALLLKVQQSAAYLQHKGVCPGDFVGVMLNVNEWLPVCLYAIWATGAVYVPVNPAYPALRRQMMVEDAGCKIVLTGADLPAISAHPVINDVFATTYTEMAYVLYTSGTTGKPKGVVVSHQALLQKLQVELTLIGLKEPVNACLVTNYCFDVSFLELLLPVLTGGRLAIPESQLLLQQEYLAGLLVQQRVNVLHGTPTFIDSFFQYLPDEAFVKLAATLQVICTGGESLYTKLVNFIKDKLPGVKLNNHYGPTEAVIHAVVYENICSFPKNIIGRPMPGVKAYVLNQHLRLVPPGVTGELYIGGQNAIAEGYLNRPGETAAKFITNPLLPAERIYATGDQVRWTHEQVIEFLGRNDEQVKIRGMRIELDEIQRALEAHPGVGQAVVIAANKPGGTLLFAFIVQRSILEEKVLKQYLQKILPDYMVPSFWIMVNEIPLNENGKVDKVRLLQLADQHQRVEQIIQPRTAMEKQLAAVWQQLLGLPVVGINENFFDLGGNSILLVRMRMQLKREMGIHLDIKDLLNLLTIEELAAMITSLQWLQQTGKDAANKPLEEFTI